MREKTREIKRGQEKGREKERRDVERTGEESNHEKFCLFSSDSTPGKQACCCFGATLSKELGLLLAL